MSEYSIIVGGYTDSPDQGIYRLTYDVTREVFSLPRLVCPAHNPSIAMRNGNVWYAVEEAKPGKIHVYDAQRSWQPVLSLECGGASPCHLAVNTRSGHLAVANYMGGNLAIFRLADNGLPQPGPHVIDHQGRGVSSRQEAPHVHYVDFAENNLGQLGLYAVDLGLDKVFWYPHEGGNNWGAGICVYNAQPGDGPRHFARHLSSGVIYVLNELSSSVTVIQVEEGGQWVVQQRVSTLPDSYCGDNIAAHISISDDGQYVYTSNRGHHSIAVFRVQPQGTLQCIQIEPCGGQWPRYFTVINDAARLVVAHEHTHSLAAFALEEDGRLRATPARGSAFRPTFVALEF